MDALLLQRLQGLRTTIVELTRLTNLQRTGAKDENLSSTPEPSREGEGSGYFFRCTSGLRVYTPLPHAGGVGGEAFYELVEEKFRVDGS